MVSEKQTNAIQLPVSPSPVRNQAPAAQQLAKTMPAPNNKPPASVAETGS